MFDFGVGYSELFVLAIVAVIVIGPKDLPKVLRAFGKTMQKMRGMAREFQGHLDSAMKDACLEDVKREFQGLKASLAGDLQRASDPEAQCRDAPLLRHAQQFILERALFRVQRIA